MSLRVAAIVLAAGQSRRWRGARPKLLSTIAGRPLVAIAADAALEAQASSVFVVVGRDSSAIQSVLSGRSVHVIDNADHDSGIASSIRAGIAAVSGKVDGCLILLADMPLVTATHLRRLTDAFEASQGKRICVPVYLSRRGNPVLWPARFFADLMALSGDMGGRKLFDRFADDIHDVEMDNDGILIDVDTCDQFVSVSKCLRKSPG